MTTLNKTLSTLALVGATALPVGALAGAASAHDELTGTTPSTGSTVTGAPSSIALTFGEKPLDVGNQIAVKGPDGSTTTATPTVKATTVSAPFTSHGNGLYTVTWRVVSGDGHPVSGTYTFTLKGASSAASTAASSTGSTSASREASTSAAASATSTSTFAPSSPSSASKAHDTDDGGAAWGVIGGVAALAAAVVAAVVLASRRRRG